MRARDPKDPTIITALDLTEISLVDRPANPEAVIQMWKADDPISGVDIHDDADPAAASGTADGATGPTATGSGPVPPPPEPAPDPHKCPTCGATLKCQRCHATAVETKAEYAGELLKMVRGLAGAERDPDDALRKVDAALRKIDAMGRDLRKLAGERDSLRKRLTDASAEVEAANRELARRPKGALRAVPLAVEKRDDVAGAAAEPEQQADALALIKRAHRNPHPQVAGDGGPLLRK